MPCGLAHIPRHEIDAWSETHPVRATLFDTADGVRMFSAPRYYTAAAARAADGRIWFASPDGASVIDPGHLPFNTLPPPVHVEQVIADRKVYIAPAGSAAALRLPALTNDVEIDYTALSFVAPEKMQFRYKLEGHDRDWQDVGTRRQAFYTNLRPRGYRFRVMAANNSGVWNEAGAAVDFVILPAYYQTTWFAVLTIGLILGIAWTAHRVRLRIVEKHQREIGALNERLMKAQEQERIRIAGELHDGVMQEMLAATMMLGAAKRRIPDDIEAKAKIDKVQDKLIRVGTDIRRLSHDLHPPVLQEAGLPQALQICCEEFSAAAGIPVYCEADDRARDLSRGAALALFRIVQEALGNAAKHARATRITVRLTRSDDQVFLVVSDDGVGFEDGRLGAPGGLGLVMMRERATQLSGTFEFDSAAGRGTTIKVIIPFR
jgi:signal transduction histidine kinase